MFSITKDAAEYIKRRSDSMLVSMVFEPAIGG
jgi:hypothetical protein